MFSNKYRYLIIIILAVYSYLNSLFSEVYTYYRIEVPWHTALVAFLLITLFVWEGNRLLQKVLLRYFTRVSQVSFLLIFFTAGVFISTLLSIGIVLGINFFFLQQPVTFPYKKGYQQKCYQGSMPWNFDTIVCIYFGKQRIQV